MMKLIYYPVFFGLRKLGRLPGIVFATFAVFLGTWLLHSYQWFWLRGSFPLTTTDGVFWGILAVLVVTNSLLETRKTSKRSLGKASWSLAEAFVISLKTVGMFSLMCVLWSFWNSATVAEWLAAVSHAGASGLAEVGLLLLGLSGAVVLGVIVQYLINVRTTPAASDTGSGYATPGILQPVPYTLVVSAVLIALSLPQVTDRLGAQTVQVAHVLQEDRLNARDRELVDRGYYEGLLDNPRFTSALSVAQGRRPRTQEWADTRHSRVVRYTGDLWEYELRPSYVGTYKDAPFVTNQWGMRDREYTQEKPAGG